MSIEPTASPTDEAHGDASSPSSPSPGGSGTSTTIGRSAFALSVVSLIVYYATSHGVRHFITFVMTTGRKLLQAFGHGG